MRHANPKRERGLLERIELPDGLDQMRDLGNLIVARRGFCRPFFLHPRHAGNPRTATALGRKSRPPLYSAALFDWGWIAAAVEPLRDPTRTHHRCREA